MYFGSTFNRDASFSILDKYRGAGGDFLDTANIYAGWIEGYHGGESESLIGDWMQSRHCRDEVFLATKVGGVLHLGHESLHEDQPRLRAQQIVEECEQSLNRLQCETIDLYYTHVDDRLTPLEETLKALDQLKQAGKIRFIGASNIASWRLAQANLLSELNHLISYCCVQQKFTYLSPSVGAKFEPQVHANDDLLDYCEANHLTLLAYSPLVGGAYTRLNPEHVPPQYQTGHLQRQLQTIGSLAEKYDATPNQIVLAWLMQSAISIIPVMGVDTVEQLEENLGSVRVQLSQEHMTNLNQSRLNLS